MALISGGGSGHEPLHAGFVGHGMLDAACPGQVFTSPTPDQMLAAAQAVDGGAGILFIVKNYEGDVMNFDMAAEMAAELGARSMIGHAPTTTWRSRIRSTRPAGAASPARWSWRRSSAPRPKQGWSLAALKALGDRVNARTRSMGVALTSCTVPAAGKPTFAIGEDEMEMGVGIHGEPGRRRVKLQPADAHRRGDGGRHPRRSRRRVGRSAPPRQRLRRHAG